MEALLHSFPVFMFSKYQLSSLAASSSSNQFVLKAWIYTWMHFSVWWSLSFLMLWDLIVGHQDGFSALERMQ